MATAVVTGSNSGIGRSTALRLAQDGYTVFGGMRNLASGAKLAAMAEERGVTVTPVTIDVSDDASVAAAFEQIQAAGPVDVLVNNAGVGMNATIEDIDLAAAKALYDVNVWGLVRCTQAVLPGMRAQGSGTIVNISSVTGHIAAIGQAVYSSSKWAVECMSDNLAQEVARFGLRVKVIEPGVTRTAILPKNMDHPTQGSAYKHIYDWLDAFYVAGAMAEVRPDVVADVVAGAIADESSRLRYVCAWSGQEIVDRRPEVSDADWIALGASQSDEEYFDRFEAAFGLDIRPPA